MKTSKINPIEGYRPYNNANLIAAANPKWKIKQPAWFWVCCLLGISVHSY